LGNTFDQKYKKKIPYDSLSLVGKIGGHNLSKINLWTQIVVELRSFGQNIYYSVSLLFFTHTHTHIYIYIYILHFNYLTILIIIINKVVLINNRTYFTINIINIFLNNRVKFKRYTQFKTEKV